MSTAFQYFEDSFPMLEGDYPYTSGTKRDDSTNWPCHYSASKAINVKVKSIENTDGY